MTTRELTKSDIPALKELEQGFEWEFALDYIGGLVVADAQNRPVGIAGAWKRAETHTLIDSSWGTPGGREAVLELLHRDFGEQLKSQGYTQVVTFMEDKVFGRRLPKLGWLKSDLPSWHRGL